MCNFPYTSTDTDENCKRLIFLWSRFLHFLINKAIMQTPMMHNKPPLIEATTAIIVDELLPPSTAPSFTVMFTVSLAIIVMGVFMDCN